MDNIFIIIAAVAFFIFQTYSNYKKEQEEAKTRDASKRRPNASESIPEETSHPPMEIPKWLEDFLPPQEEIRQKPKRVYEIPEPVSMPTKKHHGSMEYQRVKYVPSELPADLLRSEERRVGKEC